MHGHRSRFQKRAGVQRQIIGQRKDYALGENGIFRHHPRIIGYPFAKMRLFVGTIIAAAAGAAEIHRNVLTDFEIPFNILA